MKKIDNKLIFEYKEDKDEYMRVLDTCIEYYKTTSSYLNQGLVSSCNVIISVVLTLLAVYLASKYASIEEQTSGILNTLVRFSSYGSVGIIFAIFALILLIGIFYLVFLIVSFITPRILKKTILKDQVTMAKTMEKAVSKLQELYLAKIEPETWRLIVEKDEGEKSIMNVTVKLIETPKKQESELCRG